MKYYLCIDSGGTKAAAILYNGDFECVRACTVGSIRGNSSSAELVKRNADSLIEKLGLPGLTIEHIDGTYEAHMLEAIKKVCLVKSASVCGELELGLSAAGIFGDGLLALCGTGATLFGRVNGKKIFTGGFGSAVSDEGSGYWIGREAFNAAIHDKEERGERTALTDLIPKKLGFSGRDQLVEAIFSIYGRADRSPVASVASCSVVVVEAARQNDAVAVSILKRAGELIAAQMKYLIKHNSVPVSVPMTISGSVWRANRVLFDSFCKNTDRPVIIPRLEPALGVIARHYYESRGYFGEKGIRELSEAFPKFTYDIDKSKI